MTGRLLLLILELIVRGKTLQDLVAISVRCDFKVLT